MVSDLHYSMALDILSGRATLDGVPDSMRADVARAMAIMGYASRLPDKDKK